MDNNADKKTDEFVAFFFKKIPLFLLEIVTHTIGQIALVVAILLLVTGYNSENSFIRVPVVVSIGILCLLLMLCTGWTVVKNVRKPTRPLLDRCLSILFALMGFLTGASVLLMLGPGMIDRLSSVPST